MLRQNSSTLAQDCLLLAQNGFKLDLKTIKNCRKNDVFGFRRRTNVAKTDVFYFWPQNCLVLAQDGPDMFSGLPNIALKCSHVAP